MAIMLKVQWVEQSPEAEARRRIKHIGGVTGNLRWKHTEEFAIEAIERGQFAYYVELGTRISSVGIARADDGSKFLTAGGEPSQLLLNLPEFPNVSRPFA
ncbi:MAG TPA: DUF3892 domain-containing protein [Verrucomicrobiae bacterium]|nr:DUF3892 domain-containing protein [Verrucomicrobiae bacterium]